MTLLGGSLRFVQLPVVVQLLADLAGTGRLTIVEGDWSGDLVLVRGQIVDAHLEVDASAAEARVVEHGRAAFESITLGLRQADFSFVQEPNTLVGDRSSLIDEAGGADQGPLIQEAERVAYMTALSDESARLARRIPTLSSIPRFSDGGGETQITIKRATLNIIPLIATGQTLEAIARERGLARTLRDVASLIDAGIICVDDPTALPQQWAAELKRPRLVP